MSSQPMFMSHSAFHDLASRLGWDGDVVHQDGDQTMVRPADLLHELPLSDFFDAILNSAYCDGSEHLVLATINEKVELSFATWLGRDPLDGFFMGRGFAPENNDILYAIPKESTHRLPDHLWLSPSFLSEPARSVHILVKKTDGTHVIHQRTQGYFFEVDRNDITGFIPAGLLNNWLATPDGIAFAEREAIALFKEKCPLVLELKSQGMAGADLILAAQ